MILLYLLMSQHVNNQENDSENCVDSDTYQSHYERQSKSNVDNKQETVNQNLSRLYVQKKQVVENQTQKDQP